MPTSGGTHSGTSKTPTAHAKQHKTTKTTTTAPSNPPQQTTVHYKKTAGRRKTQPSLHTRPRRAARQAREGANPQKTIHTPPRGTARTNQPRHTPPQPRIQTRGAKTARRRSTTPLRRETPTPRSSPSNTAQIQTPRTTTARRRQLNCPENPKNRRIATRRYIHYIPDTRRRAEPPPQTDKNPHTPHSQRGGTQERKTFKLPRSGISALLQNDAGQKPGRLTLMFPGSPLLGTQPRPGRRGENPTPPPRRSPDKTHPPGGLAAVRNRLILPDPTAIGVGLSHASRAPGGARERRTAQ